MWDSQRADKQYYRCLTGISGTVVLDENADRQPDYWLWGLEPFNDEFTMLADILVKETPKLVSTLQRIVLRGFAKTPQLRPYLVAVAEATWKIKSINVCV